MATKTASKKGYNYWAAFGWMIAGLGLTILAYWVWSMFQKDKQKEVAIKDTDWDLLLYKGVKAPKEVIFVQNYLNGKGASPKLEIDGIFGPKTEAALVAYLGKNKATIREIVIFQAQITADAGQEKGAPTSGGDGTLNTTL